MADLKLVEISNSISQLIELINKIAGNMGQPYSVFSDTVAALTTLKETIEEVSSNKNQHFIGAEYISLDYLQQNLKKDQEELAKLEQSPVFSSLHSYIQYLPDRYSFHNKYWNLLMLLDGPEILEGDSDALSGTDTTPGDKYLEGIARRSKRLNNAIEKEIDASQTRVHQLELDYAATLTDHTIEAKSSLKALVDLINLYRGYEKNFDETIGKSNRIQLESAFQKKADSLNAQKWWWGAGLLAALACMTLNAYKILSAPPADLTWQLLVSRALLTLPLIWVAWFCAKQFGYTSRLQEDYSFKVSTARSYLGYKSEADINEQLKAKLLELTLTTFSENPLRIYKIPSDAGTPLQEIAEGFAKLRNSVSSDSQKGNK
ncbi:hypothetical protein [Variovorax sp. DAIF25]|uniref:hypothetical protein n=1 Tax=Variovorax sp. DAIF25 TaxID=3080983 RepID=UPI003D6A4E74